MRRVHPLSRLPRAFALLTLLSAPVLAAPPALPADFFGSHRQRFLDALPAGAVVVVRSAPDPDVEVDTGPYRQDSDLWYLTGVSEPDVVAVLRKDPPDGKRVLLFVRPKEYFAEIWSGWRTGLDGARKIHGADEAFPIDELPKRLPALLAPATSLYHRVERDAELKGKLLDVWSAGSANAAKARPAADAAPILHQQRLVKDATEIELLRKVSALTVEAHLAAMKALRPGAYEHALTSAMVGTCLAGGAARMGYPPIVGSGPNAVVLHYRDASRVMNAGEMVVNDTACELSMYTADVTRSYPVSRRFTPEQRALYEIVLAAQKAGIAKVRPGAPFHEIYDATVDVVVDGLLKLGLLKGDKAGIVASKAYKRLYPHGSSHWLGLNVHDVGSYQVPPGAEDRWDRYRGMQVKLEPGMALTVEPGIYVAEGSEGIDPKWWNIGVRIEDDVLVTPAGAECLTCSLPRELADLERALR